MSVAEIIKVRDETPCTRVTEQRRTQGLPEKVEDPVVLDEVARLILLPISEEK